MTLKKNIEYLESLGCSIVPLEVTCIPEMNVGHLVAISAESAEAARGYIHEGARMSPENTVILNAALSSLTAADYILSAKLRSKIMEDLGKLYKYKVIKRS